MLEFIVIILIELYFLFCGFQAGYIYHEMKDKSNDKFRTLLNALFYGFFGIYMMLFYKLKNKK